MPGKKPDYNFAGTAPRDHGLDGVRERMIRNPRQRLWGIVEFRNTHTGTDHPDDEADEQRPLITYLSLEPITDTAEIDQLRAMRDRARLNRPGQGTMDEAAQAQHAGEEGGGQAIPFRQPGRPG